MIYRTAPFSMTLNNPKPRFQGHGYTIGALDVLCAQMTRDLFVIAEFLFLASTCHDPLTYQL